jgi:hypothetical protein
LHKYHYTAPEDGMLYILHPFFFPPMQLHPSFLLMREKSPATRLLRPKSQPFCHFIQDFIQNAFPLKKRWTSYLDSSHL